VYQQHRKRENKKFLGISAKNEEILRQFWEHEEKTRNFRKFRGGRQPAVMYLCSSIKNFQLRYFGVNKKFVTFKKTFCIFPISLKSKKLKPLKSPDYSDSESWAYFSTL
jgi:hypothetical protein